MTARVLMLQGTGSDVGKSVLTAALCRIAKRRGFSVAPFKPQNMSNNAAACADGGEIGRAQAMQARAACIEAHTDMNPVLLKPQTDRMSQVVVQGKAVDALAASDFLERRYTLMNAVMESFSRLTEQYDLVLIEGAGSPAEINLRHRDIANMGFAREAGVPVCLVGDIDRGGVIASIVGTKTVIDPKDANMVRGFLINKFRGDPSLFVRGITEIEKRTSWPCFGVIPWLSDAHRLPAEDAVPLSRPLPPSTGRHKIVAPILSRMANFDDADPIRLEPSIDFEWIAPGNSIPRDAEAIMLFGTKSSLGDLDFIRTQGWDHDIIAHARSGGRIIGICGGYQILGKTISDPSGVDGESGSAKALGLLDVETVMTDTKRVTPVEGKCARTGEPITGYEIHMGQTTGPDTQAPFALVKDENEGSRSPDGRIEGTYLHGVFSSDTFRRAWLKGLGFAVDDGLSYESEVEKAIESLADGVEVAVNVEALFSVMAEPGWSPSAS